VPGSTRAATAGSDIPASLPMTYKIMKKGRALPAFAPVSISDDGRKTTFVITPGAPMPTIFRADAKGQEYSVNSSVRGTTITVSTRSERWVLRYGDEYVCVTGDAGVSQ
jgi:type IV secretion system protein VirB9